MHVYICIIYKICIMHILSIGYAQISELHCYDNDLILIECIILYIHS